MIVKYLKGGSWVYIDSVQRVENSAILPLELAKQFDEEVKNGKRSIEDCSTGLDEPMDSTGYEKVKNIEMENKAFLMATENQKDWGYNVHVENNLHADLIKGEFPTRIVLIYTPKRSEENTFVDYETIALITDQNVFLMNDKGQTIERLV